jgi:O-antigen/teichoic acid export membrane protein
MKPLARIVQLSAAFLGSNLARAVIGFGLSLVLGRGLGAERFGRWMLCVTWASTLTVVTDLGFGVLLTRDGARADGEPGRLISGALVLRLAVALPLAAVLYVFAGRLASEPESINGLRAAALLGIAGAVYGCFGALFRSQPRWLPTVLAIETLSLAAQVAGSWWLVREGRGVVALASLAIALQLAQIAAAGVLWRPAFGGRARLARSDGARAFQASVFAMLVRALPFAASGIVANLQTRVAPLMLGSLSTPSELGWFAAASRFGSVARLAPQAIFAGALPVLSHEYGRDRSEAHRVSRTLDRALLALSGAVAVGCLLLAGPMMRLVYGPSFAAAAPALIWVGVGLIPSLSNSGRKVFLYAAGGEALVVRWSAAGLVIQVLSAALLIPSLGSMGAAMSAAIGEAAIWLPFRRAVRAHSTGEPSTRQEVRLKADTTYAKVST